MLTLITNGEVFTPEPRGRQSILLSDASVAKIGEVSPRSVEALGVDHDIVNAEGCLVVPGFIDPHQHLLGGSGEAGFSSQSPEFFLTEIVQWGITSVVGLLGTDTTMKTLAGLLAKVKALKEQGLNAFMWTGGYNVPPNSILATVREDIMFVDEIIGVGEVAVSDLRAMDPDPHQLAKIVTDCYIGGRLARKSCVTHFHVGDKDTRLAPLRALVENHHVEPSWLYPTHIERSEALMREAIDLAARGAFVDIDVVNEDLPKWLRFYLENGGHQDQLTVSSDAGATSPRTLYEQICRCLRDGRFPPEHVLALATRNPARVLGLRNKGMLEKGKDGDVTVLRKDTLEVVHVLSRGRFMVRDGEPAVSEVFLKESNREIRMRGEQL